jgi:hypothetical protein
MTCGVVVTSLHRAFHHVLSEFFSAQLCAQSLHCSSTIRTMDDWNKRPNPDLRRQNVLKWSWKPNYPRLRDTVAELYSFFTRSTSYFNNKRSIYQLLKYLLCIVHNIVAFVIKLCKKQIHLMLIISKPLTQISVNSCSISLSWSSDLNYPVETLLPPQLGSCTFKYVKSSDINIYYKYLYLLC